MKSPSQFGRIVAGFGIFVLALAAAGGGLHAAEGLKIDKGSPIYQAAAQKALDLTDEVTLEAWVQAGKMGSGGGRILDKSAPGTSEAYMLDTFPGNSLRFLNIAGSVGCHANLPGDKWTHVAGVYSCSKKIMKLYVNGKEVASNTHCKFIPMTLTTLPLSVGASPTGAERFSGRILRAAIYGRALSAEEIARRAGDAEAASLDGVIGEWKFAVKNDSVIKPVAGAVSLQASNGAAAVGGVAFEGQLLGEAPAPQEPLSLWYRKPAGQWVEALPVGNGRLAAMVFGGIDRERIQLNEGTLWGGGPYDPANPEALAALPEARRLIFEGKFTEAHKLIGAKMMGKPATQMPYQPVGDLNLTFGSISKAEDYRRELNLDTAIASVSYTVDGVRFKREVFSSAVDQTIVVRITADRPGKISFAASFNSPQKVTIETQGSDTLVMRGENGKAKGIDGALKFQARAIVRADGGKTAAADNRIVVSDADSATLLIAAATSYKNYKDVSGDPEKPVKDWLAAAAGKTFYALLDAHVAEHRRLFRRFQVDLGNADAMKKPTDQRIAEFATSDDPQLAALYLQFGRYLLISGSRPGGQPATLQGLWNDHMNPPWDSKYTININTEMNYWPAEPGNLGECVEPLIAMVNELVEPGSRTAKVQWGARGWVCHHNTDLWRATAPIDGPTWGFWPMGGAWLCKHLWDHYDFNRDKAYLAKVYPTLKGAAQFFLDTLVEEPKHKWLVTCPSLSPENTHPGGASVCAGPAMDMEILRDLFANCIEAAKILNVDEDFRKQLIDTRQRLAPAQIGQAGQLQEWLDDWDMKAREIHHRHVSHLYGLFPSGQISLRGTPELAAAVRKSLEIRGDNATGWGLGWRLNLWARLQDAEHAYQILKLLITPAKTYPNMFDSCPPFQIDGNFGGASGIMEMLVQSQGAALTAGGTACIELLPALPKAWADGAVKGLRAPGGLTIEMNWKDGKVMSYRITAPDPQPIQVRVNGEVKTVTPEREGNQPATAVPLSGWEVGC